MKQLRIAVPTNNPGGLEAERSDHFGHCDLFTIVDIADGKVVSSETIENIAHSAGGCMVPVQLLRDRNIDLIVVGGMGRGPLLGFQNAGIKVYVAPRDKYENVEAIVGGVLADDLYMMDPEQACQGGGDCHH